MSASCAMGGTLSCPLRSTLSAWQSHATTPDDSNLYSNVFLLHYVEEFVKQDFDQLTQVTLDHHTPAGESLNRWWQHPLTSSESQLQECIVKGISCFRHEGEVPETISETPPWFDPPSNPPKFHFADPRMRTKPPVLDIWWSFWLKLKHLSCRSLTFFLMLEASQSKKSKLISFIIGKWLYMHAWIPGLAHT